MSVSDAPRVAMPDDLPMVTTGLRSLAQDLGDPFRMSGDQLRAALFGPQGVAFAVLAGRQGVALVQPQISTSAGGVLVYVSDLWVTRTARGSGLGRALLARCAHEGLDRWGAVGLRLAVHADNDRAIEFYSGLGFALRPQDQVAVLTGASFETLLVKA